MAEAKKTKKTTKKATKKKTTAKKTEAKRTEVRKKVTRKPPKSDINDDPNFKPLSQDEVDDYYKQLIQLRRELLGNVDQMRSEALKDSRQESSGDLSSMPIHMADIGTDNYEQEFTLGLIESERKMLKDIDFALKKIEENTYGICEATGVSIGRARLDAKPYAKYCIDYARKLEKGLVKEMTDNDTDEEAIS